MNAEMDELDEQPKPRVATNKPLEPFLILATKNTNCLDLVKQVLEAPGVHVFSELMHLPNIINLNDGTNAKYSRTLNLFAYGTYRDYVNSPEEMLELTPVMKKKLQHLTIVSLAIRNKCIPYARLLDELDITNVRDLEDLIIEAIYADIIHGKLDQKNSQLEVDYAIGRDIRPADVQDIATTLQEWCDSCETVLHVIEEQISTANSEKAQKLKHRERIDQEVANLKKTLKTQTFDMDDDMRDIPGSVAGGGITLAGSSIGQEQLRKKPNKVKAPRATGKSWFKNFSQN